MRNPYLVGTKIYLRPLEEDDAAVCHPWLNDPEVWRTLAVRGRPNTEARSREYIRALDPTRDQVFAIVTREDEQYVGNCGLHAIDAVDRHATLGIVIGRKECWGRGFGTEAVRLLCGHAFQTVNPHKGCLASYARNRRGRGVRAPPRCRSRVRAGARGAAVAEVARGEIWQFAFPRPDRRRPVLVLTRQEMIGRLSTVTVAPLTTTIRGVASEVVVGTEVGLRQPLAINLHHVATVPRAGLRGYIGTLPAEGMERVRDALLFALGFAGPKGG